jgi:hypothetical protein
MKIIISLSLLFLGPCAGHKKVSQTVPAVQDNSTMTITYKRGACMGKCPSYTMSIDGATKTITYTGTQNVEKIGVFTKPVSDEELTKLSEAFKTAGFDSLDEKYLGEVTDFPSRYITYSNNGKTKMVQDRKGAPEKLHVLETLLENIADSPPEGWTKQEAEH